MIVCFQRKKIERHADPVDLGVSIDEEETVRTVFTTLGTLLPTQGRTINNIIAEGFYRRQREVPPAVGSLFQDGQAGILTR